MITINNEFAVDVPGYEGWTSVKILGDGKFHGKMAAHNFEYNGNHYYSEIGVRSPIPVPFTVNIKNGKEIF